MKKKVLPMLLLIIGIPVIMLYSCNDDNNAGEDYNGPLKLKTFYPDSGYLTSKVIIEADGLGTDVSQLTVYFNRKKAYISQAAGDRLMVYAPKLPGDTCVISVVKGNDSLSFDQKFKYISRFTVENICGKQGSGLSLGGDLASTTFETWKLKVGCCDPEGNFYVCYSNYSANPPYGGLALISEKNNVSKKIISVIVNDVFYHEKSAKLYAVAPFRAVIYEIDPANDWKVKSRYLKLPDIPARQVAYNKMACMAYCSANDYFYVRNADQELFRFKLDDLVCEFVGTTTIDPGKGDENRRIISMMFDPTEPTKLYTSYGAPSCITVLDIADPNSTEEVYAGQYNIRSQNSPTQVINGYRKDCLFSWNNQMTIIADESGQKTMYIADAGDQCIRQIDMNTGMVTTSVGQVGINGHQSGTPLEATFFWPKGVGLTPDNDLYISDCGSGMIRKLSLQ